MAKRPKHRHATARQFRDLMRAKSWNAKTVSRYEAIFGCPHCLERYNHVVAGLRSAEARRLRKQKKTKSARGPAKVLLFSRSGGP